MERLTYIKCPHWWGHGRNPTPYSSRETFQTVCDRLGTIEDILGDSYDLDRLRELVEADRAGRCMVLPCKPGDILQMEACEKGKSIGSRPYKITRPILYMEAEADGKVSWIPVEDFEDALRRAQDEQ